LRNTVSGWRMLHRQLLCPGQPQHCGGRVFLGVCRELPVRRPGLPWEQQRLPLLPAHHGNQPAAPACVCSMCLPAVWAAIVPV
jgi:hypothetical protein